MHAIGYRTPGAPSVLEDIELPDPTPGPHDLLVEVQAVSVNPVDTKVRANGTPPSGEAKVLGWDAVGVVREVGSAVTLLQPGDEVWYAGAIDRPGSNSTLHLVDERIASRRPTTLDAASAAALPLTGLTAWELLFDRLDVPLGGGEGRTLLVVGAAGGVGSILVQLAARLTDLRVIGTASRPETAEWVRDLGAHDVIDHSAGIRAELDRIGVGTVDLIAALTHSDEHFPALVEVLTPQGAIGMIDDPASIDVRLLKSKAASLRWELMFTRSLHQTPDMVEQHRLLAALADLVDDGTIRTTHGESFGTISAANLQRAHAHVETGRAKGKAVLAGWD